VPHSAELAAGAAHFELTHDPPASSRHSDSPPPETFRVSTASWPAQFPPEKRFLPFLQKNNLHHECFLLF